MLKKIIDKYNFNVVGMLRNGTIAVVTMFGIAYLFGIKNMMLAFPIALTSTVLGRQNFHIKTINKSIRILLLELSIVIVSYLSSINMWIGIVVNFISIFLIMYTIVSPYDIGFYKPFIMLYVFTQYVTVSRSELPNRLLSVVFGCIIITLFSYIRKHNEKDMLINNVKSSLSIIKEQLSNVIKNDYQENLSDKCSKMMRALAYKVYITRYKRFLTTKLGKIQFRLFIYIEYLNLYIKGLESKYKDSDISKKDIKELINLINKVISYCKNKITIDSLYDEIKYIKEKLEGNSSYIKDGFIIIFKIINNLSEISKMSDEEVNTVYTEWERTKYDKRLYSFKAYFKKDSIRFKFAIRMAITLTVSLFAAEILGFHKVIWAVITIMSIMQPYYEDTISNVKGRIKGNAIAILITGILINIINNKIFTIVILIIALYLLYAFKKYSRISLYAGIASICLSSLSENINKLIFYRVGYLIVGVIVVLLANKYIFPYKLDDGIRQLEEKINRYTSYLQEHYKEYISGVKKENDHEIRDLIIHITLLSQKLYLRNLEYGEENIEKFIRENNNLVINIGYHILN